MTSLTALIETWRKDAELLDSYGDTQLAKACLKHAEQVEAALRSAADEELDLISAAAESGYSTDRLRHKVATGEIPNAGRKGAPRIRRGDLPSKARKKGQGFDAGSVARGLLRSSSHA